MLHCRSTSHLRRTRLSRPRTRSLAQDEHSAPLASRTLPPTPPLPATQLERLSEMLSRPDPRRRVMGSCRLCASPQTQSRPRALRCTGSGLPRAGCQRSVTTRFPGQEPSIASTSTVPRERNDDRTDLSQAPVSIGGSRYGTTKTMFLPGRRSLGACPEPVPLMTRVRPVPQQGRARWRRTVARAHRVGPPVGAVPAPLACINHCWTGRWACAHYWAHALRTAQAITSSRSSVYSSRKFAYGLATGYLWFLCRSARSTVDQSRSATRAHRYVSTRAGAAGAETPAGMSDDAITPRNTAPAATKTACLPPPPLYAAPTMAIPSAAPTCRTVLLTPLATPATRWGISARAMLPSWAVAKPMPIP